MLYKFYGADSGEKAEELLNFVCNDHTIRASDPTSFNDPFEFKVAFDFNADEDVIRRRYFKDRPGSKEGDYDEWRRTFTENARWWIAQTTRRNLMSLFGVVCFSMIEDNHLLWSHYASQHRGFCVGFDASMIENLPDLEGVGPVVYQGEAPVFRYYYDCPTQFTKSAFWCKSDCWAYEREYRVLFSRQGVVRFPIAALREVILGCRAYGELRNYAETRIGTSDVTYFQMAEDFGAYSLSKVPIQRGVHLMSSFF